jgi:hypothetical protein
MARDLLRITIVMNRNLNLLLALLALLLTRQTAG